MKNISVIVMMIILMSSCTRTHKTILTEPPKKIITNVQQHVDGVLSSYIYAKDERITMEFKVDEGSTVSGIDVEIPIKIVFPSRYSIRAGSGYNDFGPEMELEFLDGKRRVIEGLYGSMSTTLTDLASYIQAGYNREEWITFRVHYSAGLGGEESIKESKEFIDKLADTRIIRIKTSIIEEKHESAKSVSSTSSNSTSGTAGGGNCERFLSQYEEYVMAYAELARKAKQDPNNLSYMSELATVAAKATQIEGNLDQCKDDAQIATRFLELNVKMLQAMQ